MKKSPYFVMFYTIFIANVIIAIVILSCACGRENNSTLPTTEPTIVKIGNLTDKTGVASQSLKFIDMALEDMVSYYNENNVIPGVTIELIYYDSHYEAGNYVKGYHYLKQQGVDVMFTPIPTSIEPLIDYLEKDMMVLFTIFPQKRYLDQSPYVLGLGSYPEYYTYTLLDWVANNDPMYPNRQPASVGGNYRAELFNEGFVNALGTYSNTHKDKYEVVDLIEESFWSTVSSAEKLKDCDYVIPPIPMNQFLKDFCDHDYQAEFLCNEAPFINDLPKEQMNNLVDCIDGLRIISSTPWWTDDFDVINLIKGMVYSTNPNEGKTIIGNNSTYLN